MEHLERFIIRLNPAVVHEDDKLSEVVAKTHMPITAKFKIGLNTITKEGTRFILFY